MISRKSEERLADLEIEVREQKARASAVFWVLRLVGAMLVGLATICGGAAAFLAWLNSLLNSR